MAKVRRLHDVRVYALACACVVVLFDRAHARAQEGAAEEDEPVLGLEASAEPTYAEGHDIDPTSSSSIVTLRDRVAAGEGMRDVLPEVPGLRVLAASSEGQYASVRIRGADLAHTTFLLGDIPISGADSGGFDIGALPIRLFERVEVFRGGAPAWYAENAVGGVVRFVPARVLDNRFGATLGTGSYGAGSGELEASARSGGFSLFANVGMAGARNDYPFFNDNGTILDPRDDHPDTRLNAQYLREHLFLYARQVHGGLSVDVVYFGFANLRGDPSPGDRQAAHTRAHLLRNFASAALTYDGEVRDHAYRLQAIAAFTHERLEYDDPDKEIGLSADDAIMRTTSMHGRFAGSFAILPYLEASSIVTVRHDGVYQFDELELNQIPRASRLTVTATGELRLHGRMGTTRGELRASAQQRTSFLEIPYEGLEGIEENAPQYASATYRAGAAFAPIDWLTLTSSVYSGARLPTLLETFGNSSNILPAPMLKPETSLGFDGGISACGVFGVLSLSAELRGYRNEIDDLIRVVVTSQRTARAQNVEHGVFRGVESNLDARITEHVRLQGNVTYMRTTTKGGMEVPLQPRLTVHGNATLSTGALANVVDDVSAHFGITHLGACWNDPANLVRFPTRTWLEAGTRIAMFDRRLSFAVTVRDLLDRGGRDFLGYVLPGRRVTATLAYEQEIR